MTEQTVEQKKEVRFAVVMYGGVSLAIYINGVAQELYNLVRATATKTTPDNTKTYLFPDEELTGAGKIYRALGEMLGSRFVVDILSGTSAGGINAVFLAKSLANGETFEQLKDLWIQEGDIGVLINDKESGLDKEGLKFSGEPASLLNSQRMYYKLLYALDTMNPDLPSDKSDLQPGRSPYVDELDLFVTATDIRGLIQKTRLTGGTTEEYRYKNVFRFHYATAEAAGGVDVNDFKSDNSPFLAFAARCTSAFPFAFEPMRLDDVKAVVEAPYFREHYRYDPAQWQGFYKDYLSNDDPANGDVSFDKRSFGDGGYLDNKPFSYVTETLLRRRADLPVDRKLLYIEPAPEHPTGKNLDMRPNALQNVAAALLTLPRYETIREDLNLIMERNRLIERVDSVLGHIRHVSRVSLNKNVNAWQLDGRAWAKLYLDDKVLDWYGPGYAAYQQLRVAALLDDLASGLTRAMGIDETSHQAQDFRQKTLEGWRQAYYRIDPKVKDKRKSENDLLFRLDIGWRIRRLQFMQNLINELLDGLADQAPGMNPDGQSETRTQAREIVGDSKGKVAAWPFDPKVATLAERTAFRETLLWAKAGFNEAYKDLRASGRKIRSRGILGELEKRRASLAGTVGEINAEEADLLAYGEQLKALKEALDRGADDMALFACMESLSSALASGEAKPQVRGVIRSMLSANSHQCKQILDPALAPEGLFERLSLKGSQYPSMLKKALSHVRACLDYYYNRYEYYDMLTFPLFFGSEVGESDVVEIIRISPEDAPSLRPGSQKLAGTKLGNFGAFFVRSWRENDILWGRLDGAECLIKALLPGEENTESRAALTREAHQAILQETFLGADQKQLFEALRSGQAGALEDTEGVRDTIMRALGGPKGMLEHFRHNYKVDPDFPPETTLQVSARASRVTGKVLSTLPDKSSSGLRDPAVMLARLGTIFNGLVQLALPQSIPHLIFNSLVWLLYLLELILFVGGRLTGLPGVSLLGAIGLGLTLATHLGVLYLGAFLKQNLPALRAVHGLIMLLAVLAALGLFFLAYLGLVYLGFLGLPPGTIGSWLRGFQAS